MNKLVAFGLAYFLLLPIYGQSYYYDSAYHYRKSNIPVALLYVDSALRVADNDRDIANAYYMAGWLHRRSKDYNASIKEYFLAMDLYKDMDIAWYMRTQLNQAVNYEMLLSFKLAKHYYQRAKALAIELQDDYQLARANKQLARVYRKTEQYDSAVMLNLKALDYYTKIEDKNNRSSILNELGLTLLASDNPVKAIDLFYAADRTVDKKTRTARVQYSIGSAYLSVGDTAKALASYTAADTLLSAITPEINCVALLVEMAPLTTNARQYYLRAVEYAEAYGFTHKKAYRTALEHLAEREPDLYLHKYILATNKLLDEKEHAISQNNRHLDKEEQLAKAALAELDERTFLIKTWQWIALALFAICTPGIIYLILRIRKSARIKREILSVIKV